MGQILIAISLLLLALIGLLALIASSVSRRFLTESLSTASRLGSGETGLVFSDDLLEGLPEPVKRYFRHAIANGTPLHRAVDLRIDGTMQLSPAGPRLPFTSRERLHAANGFIWAAVARMNGLPVVGSDSLINGEGGMHWRLLGLLSVAKADGPEVTDSAVGRMAAELVWLPAALLPLYGAVWEALNDHELRCSITLAGRETELLLMIDNNGRLLSLRMQRLRNLPDGSSELQPFGMDSDADISQGGYTVPRSCIVSWHPDAVSRFDFWHGHIEEISYS